LTYPGSAAAPVAAVAAGREPFGLSPSRPLAVRSSVTADGKVDDISTRHFCGPGSSQIPKSRDSSAVR
jgi:hypothetical protein